MDHLCPRIFDQQRLVLAEVESVRFDSITRVRMREINSQFNLEHKLETIIKQENTYLIFL